MHIFSSREELALKRTATVPFGTNRFELPDFIHFDQLALDCFHGNVSSAVPADKDTTQGE